MKKSVKGQFQIGFGMIFSIILIVAFIVVAIIAINAFLGIRCNTEEGRFVQALEREVNFYYTGAGVERTKIFKIFGCDFEQVCFYNSVEDPVPENSRIYQDMNIVFEDNNMYFIPSKKSKLGSVEIAHIDIEKITEERNPYCIEKVNDEVEIKFEKKLGDTLVFLS